MHILQRLLTITKTELKTRYLQPSCWCQRCRTIPITASQWWYTQPRWSHGTFLYIQPLKAITRDISIHTALKVVTWFSSYIKLSNFHDDAMWLSWPRHTREIYCLPWSCCFISSLRHYCCFVLPICDMPVHIAHGLLANACQHIFKQMFYFIQMPFIRTTCFGVALECFEIFL